MNPKTVYVPNNATRRYINIIHIQKRYANPKTVHVQKNVTRSQKLCMYKITLRVDI
jgi:hypothetical protein